MSESFRWTGTIEWWREEGHIIDSHAEELKQRGMKQMAEMVADDCSCGELLADVYDEGLNAEVTYRGWWKLRMVE